MSKKPVVDPILLRFHNLLFSYEFARDQLKSNSNQADSSVTQKKTKDRALLAVEQQAVDNRKAEAANKSMQQKAMQVELNAYVDTVFRERIQDIDMVVEKTIGTSDAVPAVLDLLSIKAASISRIDPLISGLAWLSEDILHFINLPVYQKANAQEKVKVDKVKTALSYIGIENLPFLIPSFAARQWLPHSTAPFKLMKRKLLENGLASAICCRQLAKMYEKNEATLFIAGMFHDIGKSAIVRIYYRVFDEVWKEKLTEARNNRLKDRHDALVDLEPDPIALRDLMLEFSASLSVKIIEQFKLKRLMIASPLQECADKTPYAEMSKQAKILSKGIAYSHFRALQQHHLISNTEAKSYLTRHHINVEEITALRKLSLKRLNLNVVKY